MSEAQIVLHMVILPLMSLRGILWRYIDLFAFSVLSRCLFNIFSQLRPAQRATYCFVEKELERRLNIFGGLASMRLIYFIISQAGAALGGKLEPWYTICEEKLLHLGRTAFF